MREPDLEANGVRAWRVTPKRFARPDHAATLAIWYLNGPFHPAWAWWVVSVIHLRDLLGVPPAKKHYPEAEHEFMIASLDPRTCPPDLDAVERGEGESRYLVPIDVVYQFHGVTDAQAAGMAESAVRAIVAGAASPDQDYRTWWRAALDGTVACIRAGRHP